MNSYLKQLNPYPFTKLDQLLEGITPRLDLINLSVGEPKLSIPKTIRETLIQHANQPHVPYNKVGGHLYLRKAIASYLTKRFGLPSDAIDLDQHILPLNGTREGLFSVAQALGVPTQSVLMPDPCYQIYEGAAIMLGAKSVSMAGDPQNGFVLDPKQLSAKQLRDCTLMYVCSPTNPGGVNLSKQAFMQLFELADQYNFCLLIDECYLDLYLETPTCSALTYAIESGRTDFKNMIVFHSLSKRSNMAGLRSGFAFGDANYMAKFKKYRTYHGVTMPDLIQQASSVAWLDDTHVEKNRQHYQKNIEIARYYLGDWVSKWPQVGFFILLNADDDLSLTKNLYEHAGIKVLPLQFLTRHSMKSQYVRVALVHAHEIIEQACKRIRKHLST